MDDISIYISLTKGHRLTFVTSGFRLQNTIRYWFIQWCDRSGLEIVIYNVIETLIITTVNGAIPPVENNIIDKVKVSIHTYRTVTTDI